MYKNNGDTSFTLTAHTRFTAQAGTIVAADIKGDLNQDLVHYSPFATAVSRAGRAGGYSYVLGLGNDTLGIQGTLAGTGLLLLSSAI